MIGSALIFSGILLNQFKAFCVAIKLSIFIRPVFNKYVYPVICHQWHEHKLSTINSILSSPLPIWLARYGQFDSPRFCAKYCTYSIMDMSLYLLCHTDKIMDFKLIQKGQIKGNLERQACE